MKPFFTYFGGKYRIALRYPKPKRIRLIEAFAGSAGYATRYPNYEVHLYEVNPKVFGTWEFLIQSTPEEIMQLPLKFKDVRDLGICQEAKWLIGWWLNKGHTQPCNIPGQWMRLKPEESPNARPNSFWGEVIRQRIADQVNKINHWKVFLKSWETIPNDRATWFIDPPYQRSGRHYVYSSVDYVKLGLWTDNRKGQVIACGQQGDSWREFSTLVETRGTGGYKYSGTSKEVVWLRKN